MGELGVVGRVDFGPVDGGRHGVGRDSGSFEKWLRARDLGWRCRRGVVFTACLSRSQRYFEPDVVELMVRL
jgi:hypothetical protein